jgi:hypothetical protein
MREKFEKAIILMDARKVPIVCDCPEKLCAGWDPTGTNFNVMIKIIRKALTDCKVKGFLITILADEDRGEMGYIEITDKHKAKDTAMEELKSYSIPAN